jgi:hypothetical protein
MRGPRSAHGTADALASWDSEGLRRNSRASKGSIDHGGGAGGEPSDKGSRAVKGSQLLKSGQKLSDGGIDRLWSFQSGKMPDLG